MLSIAIGDKGSFCDNCAAPALKGFELTGFRGIFFCTTCAERKFGERETQRAMNAAKGVIEAMTVGAFRITGAIPRDPLLQRPMGFLRREDPDPPGPSCVK